MTSAPVAPSWHVTRWFNSAPLTLGDLRGKVVVAHAFQMLCPGCAMQALPQMKRVQHMFPPERLAVIGLHTVFEHHQAQGPQALEAFLHEYRYTFPVGVDEHAQGDQPRYHDTHEPSRKHCVSPCDLWRIERRIG